jgi:CBS domain-containing protein
MAFEVAEIMNKELFSVRAEEASGDVIGYLLALGVSAAPVLDGSSRPIGFVALRDLVEAGPGSPVFAVMSSPTDVIATHASIRAAADLMARRSRHHLVCVDVDGRAVGFVSLLDVVRGLIGAPVCHPESFPHYDPQSGLSWTDPIRLAFGTVSFAPVGPGLIVLVDGHPGRPDRVVWSEASDDVRARLQELVSRPGAAPSEVRDAAIAGHLWFRAASCALRSAKAMAQDLRERMTSPPL